jgi:hypothetical protein
MDDIQLNAIINNIKITDNEKAIIISFYRNGEYEPIYTIYKDDGTIYCTLSDKNEKALDIPQWVFLLRDMIITILPPKELIENMDIDDTIGFNDGKKHWTITRDN